MLSTRLAAISILLPLILSGCCYINKLTSFTDPDFSNPRYSRIVVHAPMANFEWRRRLEGSITEELLYRELTAYTGASVVPPTRDWTAETEMETIKGSKAEALLRITISGVSIHESYVPPKTETTVGHETKERKSGEIKKVDTTEVVTTTTTGGYTQRTTTTSIQLELIDLVSGRRAWIATTDLPYSFPRCADDFASKLADLLADEGMIR